MTGAQEEINLLQESHLLSVLTRAEDNGVDSLTVGCMQSKTK